MSGIHTLNKSIALVLKKLTDLCVSKTEASSTPQRANCDPKLFTLHREEGEGRDGGRGREGMEGEELI